MTAHPTQARDHLKEDVLHDGFAFATADAMRDLLPVEGLTDWPVFACSWDRLEPDAYLAAQGRHRRRRHAVFHALPDGSVHPQPHQPHYQSLQYNRLQGDIQRWFAPIESAVASGASLQRILAFATRFFDGLLAAPGAWRIEVHQFRIEARIGQAGEPTPEGVHRDGVDYVLVLMVDRQNVASGTTTIHRLDGTELGSFTLARPLDAALVDDSRVCHGVTPVTPLDPDRPAHRDVLVVTLKSLASP